MFWALGVRAEKMIDLTRYALAASLTAPSLEALLNILLKI